MSSVFIHPSVRQAPAQSTEAPPARGLPHQSFSGGRSLSKSSDKLCTCPTRAIAWWRAVLRASKGGWFICTCDHRSTSCPVINHASRYPSGRPWADLNGHSDASTVLERKHRACPAWVHCATICRLCPYHRMTPWPSISNPRSPGLLLAAGAKNLMTKGGAAGGATAASCNS